MPDVREILFPLHSNARGLVAGAPVAAVRARLKLSSLIYDTVYVEDGTLITQAGPTGSTSFHMPSDPSAAKWQSGADRRRMQGGDFTMAIGEQVDRATPATDLNLLIKSEAEISWEATFQPFLHELPAACDWVHFVGLPKPSGDLRQAMLRWIKRDQNNQALLRRIRTGFVRNRVIDDANGDLAAAIWGGAAVSVDALHQHVVQGRLDEGSTWSPVGWVLPLLVPQAQDLSWQQVAELRQLKAIRAFRNMLNEIENETLGSAADQDDLRLRVQSAYGRRLRESALDLAGLGSAIRTTVRGLVIGAVAGTACMGITGPLGALAGAALGSSIGAPIDVANVVRQRRARAWISFDDHLRAVASAV